VEPDDELSTSRLGLVTEFTGSVTRRLAAPPEVVLATVIDLQRLPEWNAAIERVTEVPDEWRRGAEWVVVMHPAGWPRWLSRSTVEELDREELRFVHTTRTDDGNPSRGSWTWQVRPAGDGAELSVTWRMCPRTLGRRSVIARLRRPMLQREVRCSLDALEVLLASDPSRGRDGGSAVRTRPPPPG
jgi:uncharacterized protein YndB with AHSA1/START domain